MVMELVNERVVLKNEVIDEVSAKWGGSQTI